MNKVTHRVDFEAAGNGCFFLFTLSSMAQLEDEYPDLELLTALEEARNPGHSKFVMTCMAASLRDKDGLIDLSDVELNFTILQAVEAMLDAFSLYYFGLSHRELIDETLKGIEQAQSEDDTEASDDGPFPNSEESKN